MIEQVAKAIALAQGLGDWKACQDAAAAAMNALEPYLIAKAEEQEAKATRLGMRVTQLSTVIDQLIGVLKQGNDISTACRRRALRFAKSQLADARLEKLAASSRIRSSWT
jgi:hypothetical protein